MEIRESERQKAPVGCHVGRRLESAPRFCRVADVPARYGGSHSCMSASTPHDGGCTSKART